MDENFLYFAQQLTDMQNAAAAGQKAGEKMNFILTLRSIGFIDQSPDQNHLGFRKNISGTRLQFCFYVNEDHVRLQTSGSGHSMQLRGINNLEELNHFCQLTFNKSIFEI